MLVAANNASRLNKCMRVRGAHLYKVTTRRRGQRKDREREREKAICQTAAISFLSRE